MICFKFFLKIRNLEFRVYLYFMYRRGVPSFSTGCSGCLFFCTSPENCTHDKYALTSPTLEDLKRFSSPGQRITGFFTSGRVIKPKIRNPVLQVYNGLATPLNQATFASFQQTVAIYANLLQFYMSE